MRRFCAVESRDQVACRIHSSNKGHRLADFVLVGDHNLVFYNLGLRIWPPPGPHPDWLREREGGPAGAPTTGAGLFDQVWPCLLVVGPLSLINHPRQEGADKKLVKQSERSWIPITTSISPIRAAFNDGEGAHRPVKNEIFPVQDGIHLRPMVGGFGGKNWCLILNEKKKKKTPTSSWIF
jgi:hypothetical protein